MDPTTAVRTDTLPAIATVVAPGALASAPFLWLLLSSMPNLRAFVGDHEPTALTSAALLWIVVGFGLDSAGSYGLLHRSTTPGSCGDARCLVAISSDRLDS